MEAEQLRQQVQQLRQTTADLPALQDELRELQDLLTARQQLQQEAADAEQVRAQVQQLQEAQVDLPALREELQQLQAAHEEAKEHVRQLKEKVSPALRSATTSWLLLGLMQSRCVLGQPSHKVGMMKPRCRVHDCGGLPNGSPKGCCG